MSGIYIHPICYSYWRLIKAGTRTYSSVPEARKEGVKEVAKGEVVDGKITTTEYLYWIGEPYPIPEVTE